MPDMWKSVTGSYQMRPAERCLWMIYLLKLSYQSFFGKITPSVPASILQIHNDMTVVADEAALSVIHREKRDS